MQTSENKVDLKNALKGGTKHGEHVVIGGVEFRLEWSASLTNNSATEVFVNETDMLYISIVETIGVSHDVLVVHITNQHNVYQYTTYNQHRPYDEILKWINETVSYILNM